MSLFLLYYSNLIPYIKKPSSPVNMASWTASLVTSCNIAHCKSSLKKKPTHWASVFTVWFCIRGQVSDYRAVQGEELITDTLEHISVALRPFPSISNTVQMSKVERVQKALSSTSHISDQWQKKLYIQPVSPALRNAKVNYTKSINSTCHKPHHTTA